MGNPKNSGPNRFLYEGRMDKAWKVCRWLDSSGYDPVDVMSWSDEQWEVAAGLLGMAKVPSEWCRGVAVGLLASGRR